MFLLATMEYIMVYMGRKLEVRIPQFDNHQNPNELDHYILNGSHQVKQPMKRILPFISKSLFEENIPDARRLY